MTGSRQGLVREGMQLTASITPPPRPQALPSPTERTELLPEKMASRPARIIADQPTTPAPRPAEKTSPSASPGPEKKGTDGSSENAGIQAMAFDAPFTPTYPVKAMVRELRGTVVATFKVGKNGVPELVEVIEGSSAGGFDEAVLSALAKTRIRPESVAPNTRVMVKVVFDFSGTNVVGEFSPTK